MDSHPRIRIFEDGYLGVPAPAKGWQNLPWWRNNPYLELKALEKQQVQKVTLTSPPFFFLKTEKNISHVKDVLLHQEERNIIITRDGDGG